MNEYAKNDVRFNGSHEEHLIDEDAVRLAFFMYENQVDLDALQEYVKLI